VIEVPNSLMRIGNLLLPDSSPLIRASELIQLIRKQESASAPTTARCLGTVCGEALGQFPPAAHLGSKHRRDIVRNFDVSDFVKVLRRTFSHLAPVSNAR
jgi:hypothetical protein